MQVNLSSKIETHLERLETMAEEAAKDEDESYSSRASAMSALSNILKELVKSQELLFNMTAIQELQASIVEALEEVDQEFKDNVLNILRRRLESLS